MTTADQYLARAREAIEQARGDLADAIELSPHYAVEPLRFVRAELAVVDRRLMNAERVLGGSPKPAA